MWNRLNSVVEEQAQTLVRTAFGRRRARPATCRRVYDTEGRMLARPSRHAGPRQLDGDERGYVLDKVPLVRCNDVMPSSSTTLGTGHSTT